MCERCPELEERIAWLEGELGLQRRTEVFNALRAPAAPGTRSSFTRNQSAELLAALYAADGRTLNRYQLLEAIPSPSGKDRDAKIVDVWVCWARKHLGKDAIDNVWGRGYRLSPLGMARVAALIEPHKVAA